MTQTLTLTLTLPLTLTPTPTPTLTLIPTLTLSLSLSHAGGPVGGELPLCGSRGPAPLRRRSGPPRRRVTMDPVQQTDLYVNLSLLTQTLPEPHLTLELMSLTTFPSTLTRAMTRMYMPVTLTPTLTPILATVS